MALMNHGCYSWSFCPHCLKENNDRCPLEDEEQEEIDEEEEE